MILTCKQCKESYDTAWGYHNDDYCTSSCHILQLEAEVARLRIDKNEYDNCIRDLLNTVDGLNIKLSTAKEALKGGEG